MTSKTVNSSFIFKGLKYEWLGQSTMRISGEGMPVIYTDPVFLDEDPPKAGLVLITHHHVDHCLPEYILPIKDEQTKIAAYHDSYLKYCVHDLKGVRTVKIGQTIEISGVRVTGTQAYTEKGFHTKGEGCGFLIETAGHRIFFSGDSGPTDEMLVLKDIDVAIMAICDNTHAIDARAVMDAVKSMRPGLFIPVHYTPENEPAPEITGEIFFSKAPAFFTVKYDPEALRPGLDGTGIEMAVLKKLGNAIKRG